VADRDVEQWVAANAERLHAFLRDLLMHPAPAWPPADGADAQERVADELRALGFETTLLVPDVLALADTYDSFRVGDAHAQIDPSS
jgi:hypothetical protein